MTSASELTCIYWAHCDEVTVTALAHVNIGSLICNVGAGGPAPAAGAAPTGGPAPPSCAPAEERTVEAKKEESDDDMGFGLSE
ncbi:60S acidic ribosomal protein P1-like [Myotis lucifugus]|uniref:60S acidic ribosomal protein P1-like n=1 Tax=Myotis lucifugus TaxID=59463 RepID=UPI0003C47F20|nr:60S acidic ribosomal protein P1-like [Myotis lucifugus]